MILAYPALTAFLDAKRHGILSSVILEFILLVETKKRRKITGNDYILPEHVFGAFLSPHVDGQAEALGSYTIYSGHPNAETKTYDSRDFGHDKSCS